MMKRSILYFILYSALVPLAIACHSKKAADEENAAPAPETPVTVTSIATGQMEEYVELNATSVFQQKWIVRSNVTGYLQSANVELHKFVSSGQSLFSVKTKEAQSIGNTINILDSSFRFSGVNAIRANGTGFIAELNHTKGDYVQDGEQLAVITDTKSFVFLLDLPYEMRPYIFGKSTVPLTLPDGEQLDATIAAGMPVMDSAGQTQRIVLRVAPPHPLPENLIAKVKLVKRANNTAAYLPKAAVLADETQTDFWVMKLISDSVAVKIEVKKGIESGNNIEIISPVFTPADRILVSGNFSLPDTAKVKVISAVSKNQ